MKDLHHFYTSRKNEFALECESIQRKIKKVILARVAVAIAFLILVYLGFSDALLWWGLIPNAVLFGWLIKRHGALKTEFDLNKNLEKLNGLELNALNHDYTSFADGAAFIDPHHSYSYDLDLFGPGSLYQYLNRSGTSIGEQQLARDLQLPQQLQEKIIERQKAIKELAEKTSFRQWFWAKGHLVRDSIKENEALFDWLSGKNVILEKKWIRWMLIIFPIVAVIFVLLTIIDFKYLPLVILFGGLQHYVISLFAKDIKRADGSLTKSKLVFEKYSVLLDCLAQEEFQSKRLLDLQANARLASLRIKDFSKLVNAFEARHNDIAKLFGNSLYLYDLQCLFRLEKWRQENRMQVRTWLEKIAEVDSLLSLATFHFNHPTNTFPEIAADHHLRMENVGHPLINAKERVNNSFELGHPQNVMLITGANMAGKSTFLRTVGVNLVLALAGSSVCASVFRCPLLQLHTSMRATDSLVEHQSYFYAELSRLQGIMEEVRKGKLILVLLDEILRGTNSKDKQEGSIGLIKQFVDHKALVLLASHDVVLGTLEGEFPNAIRNFCFESDVENDALKFDYTLHPGVAHKANATFLMKKMGILPDR